MEKTSNSVTHRNLFYKGPSSHRHVMPIKVFFGNLSYFANTDHLRNFLAPYGPIQAMNICKSKDADPLYYGFVHFNDIAQAERVVKELQGKKFLGRRLQLRCSDLLDGGRSGVQRGPRKQRNSDDSPSGSSSPASPSDSANEKEQGIQVLFSFMCTQPTSLLLTEEVFDAIFQSCGSVEDCVVKSHVSDMRPSEDGTSQGSADYLRQGGYGFVTFSNWADAQRAVKDISTVLMVTSEASRVSFVPLKAKPTEYEMNSFEGVLLDFDCKLSHSSKVFMEKSHPNGVAPRDTSTKRAASTVLSTLKEISNQSAGISFDSPRSAADQSLLSSAPPSARATDPASMPTPRSFQDQGLPAYGANNGQGWVSPVSLPTNFPIMSSPIGPYPSDHGCHLLPIPGVHMRPALSPTGEYAMIPCPLPSSFVPSFPQGLPPRPPMIPPLSLPVYGSYPVAPVPVLIHYPPAPAPTSWMPQAAFPMNGPASFHTAPPMSYGAL